MRINKKNILCFLFCFLILNFQFEIIENDNMQDGVTGQNEENTLNSELINNTINPIQFSENFTMNISIEFKFFNMSIEGIFKNITNY